MLVYIHLFWYVFYSGTSNNKLSEYDSPNCLENFFLSHTPIGNVLPISSYKANTLIFE